MGIFDIFKKKNKEVVQEYECLNYNIEKADPSMTQDAPDLSRIVEGLSEEEKEQILELIRNNLPIQAIKLCRELTGIGLKEAKDLVDDYEKYFKNR